MLGQPSILSIQNEVSAASQSLLSLFKGHLHEWRAVAAFSNKHRGNLHAQISDVHRAIHCLQRLLEDQEKAAAQLEHQRQLRHDESQVQKAFVSMHVCVSFRRRGGRN